MTPTTWVLERLEGGRFPFRITIRRGEKLLLALRARGPWPGAGTSVFCIREEAPTASPVGEEVERLRVLSLDRFGKRLAVVLDRARRRRCEFLFLAKGYADGQGSYEQIFWMTQQSLRARRPRGRFVGRRDEPPLEVVVDTRERYAWSLPTCEQRRERLAVGDYLLVAGATPAAVVERKTFANLLRDLSDLRALHHQLSELAAQPSPALVVEAAYADFLRESAIRPLSVAYTTRALAEIAAVHPGLQVVFAGSRTGAIQWAAAFFRAVDRQLADRSEPAVQEALALYGKPATEPGAELRVQRTVLYELPQEFSIAHLRRRFPELDDAVLRRVLHGLRARGLVTCTGRGRGARWRRRQDTV